jgi:hypothetical protein
MLLTVLLNLFNKTAKQQVSNPFITNVELFAQACRCKTNNNSPIIGPALFPGFDDIVVNPIAQEYASPSD